MSELLISAAETQTRLCQNLQDPPLGRAAWNALLRRSETRSVFLTWQWLATWWECFGAGAELYTFAALREDALVGIAPLFLRHQDGERIVEFLGMGASDYCDFIASAEDKPGVVRTVWEALLRRRDRWDRIRLRHLPGDSITARLFSELALPEGMELRTEVEAACLALSIEKNRQFAEACTNKKSLVRHTRYFERLSPLEFRNVLDSDEIADLLPEFFEQHRDRRFMAGDRSVFDDARYRRFYERLALQMLESGSLRFSVLRWRDELLACHFGLLHDGVFTFYQPTFNVDYARYSPGEVLLRQLLQDAIAADAIEFDFTVGDALFKERFANIKRHIVRLEIQHSNRVTARPARADESRLEPRHGEPFSGLGSAGNAAAAARSAGSPAAGQAPALLPAGLPRDSQPRLGISRYRLWRTRALPPVSSEFRAQWARYSQIKSLARQEGNKSEALIHALARMRRGERAVVALWQERPIALLWLARDPAGLLADLGFDVGLPEGAALITDSYLASDVEGSPRRDALMPAMQTFLAAEGVSCLFGVDDGQNAQSLPLRCGVAVEPVAQLTDVGLVFRRLRIRRRLQPPES